MLFKRHCAILPCAEKQLQREKGRAEVGRAEMSVQEIKQTKGMEGHERGSSQTQRNPTLIMSILDIK